MNENELKKQIIQRNVKNVGQTLVENPTIWYNSIVSTMENLSLHEKE